MTLWVYFYLKPLNYILVMVNRSTMTLEVVTGKGGNSKDNGSRKNIIGGGDERRQ